MFLSCFHYAESMLSPHPHHILVMPSPRSQYDLTMLSVCPYHTRSMPSLIMLSPYSYHTFTILSPCSCCALIVPLPFSRYIPSIPSSCSHHERPCLVRLEFVILTRRSAHSACVEGVSVPTDHEYSSADKEFVVNDMQLGNFSRLSDGMLRGSGAVHLCNFSQSSDGRSGGSSGWCSEVRCVSTRLERGNLWRTSNAFVRVSLRNGSHTTGDRLSAAFAVPDAH